MSVDPSRWLNTIPNLKKNTPNYNDEISDSWINSLPRRKNHSHIKRYSFTAIFFVIFY